MAQLANPSTPLHSTGESTKNAPSSLLVQAITTTAELEVIEPVWEKLWARLTTSTPFQHPAWLVPWWQHIGAGELYSLAVWNRVEKSSRELVAILPAYIHQHNGSLTRKLFPLGMATTDYLDGLFLPGYEQAAIAAILQHLSNIWPSWDVLEFPQLRQESPLLQADAGPSWQSSVTESEPCMVLDLPSTAHELDRVLPRQISKNLRYYRHRAQKVGTLRLESATVANVSPLFEKFLKLHQSRWNTRGQPGVLSHARVAEAHRQSIPRLATLGLLQLLILHLDEHPIAALYSLIDPPRDNRRLYCYLTGLDPAYEQLSPGSLLLHLAMVQAIADQCQSCDLLRGQETYKQYWGAQAHRTYRRQLSLDQKL